MRSGFNDKWVLEALGRLQVHQQLAVGAACCERMLPNYAAFMAETRWGDLDLLRGALDAVWDAYIRGESSEAYARLLPECEKSAPDAEDFSSLYVSSAQDAAFSVCALLEFLLDRSAARIVIVLRYATDSVDLLVQEQEQMNTREPQREQRILEHPLMQQELTRQQRDLSEASRLVVGDEGGLMRFRERATTESSLILMPILDSLA